MLLAAPSAAQDGREERPEVDPYTRGEAPALAQAGYVSFGVFPVGDGHDTGDVDDALGGAPVLWIETEHFRLGCSLDTYRVPRDADERRKLRGELERLGEKLPRVKPRTTKLDPWLRAHLFAQRLESLRAEFVEALRLAGPGEDGPRLAMPGKTSVLVFQRESTLARYTSTYCGGTAQDAHSHYFPDGETLLFAISDEGVDGTDTALHYGVVFGVTQSLVYSIHGFTHVPPRWWTLGLARWFARRVSPDVQLYTGAAGAALPPKELADWEKLVRGRVQAGFYPDWSSTLAWSDGGDNNFGAHVVLWSRIDFLLDQEEDVLRTLVDELHRPEPAAEDREARLAQRLGQAVFQATGMGPAELDAAWTAWVGERYGAKRKRR